MCSQLLYSGCGAHNFTTLLEFGNLLMQRWPFPSDAFTPWWLITRINATPLTIQNKGDNGASEIQPIQGFMESIFNIFSFMQYIYFYSLIDLMMPFHIQGLYKVEGDGTLTSLSQAYSFLWRKLHALLVDPIWHMSFALEAYVHVGCWVTANFIISLSENPSLERKPHLRFFPCSST